jgi:methylated-DNA-[protein]-cysteine S-methyltransferase
MPRGIPARCPVAPDGSGQTNGLSGSVTHRVPAPHQHGGMTSTATTTVRYRHVHSPLGRILLVGRDGVLTGLYLADHNHCPPVPPQWAFDGDGFDNVRQQLEEYFLGTRTEFDLALQLDGSRFQIEVWTALRAIPYGQTTSYAAIARAIGRPAAVRAVGAANGRNPISIIVPCHRVIGADGSLTGYGWGVERKSWLLDLERDPGARLFQALPVECPPGAQSVSGPG